MKPKPQQWRGIRRAAAVFSAGICLLLAVIGAVLPGLPSTPFVLLAGYLLLRSSPPLYARLQNSRWFGQLLRNWECHRAVTQRTKSWAIIVIVFCLMITFMQPHLSTWLRVIVAGCTFAGVVVILRLPVIPADSNPDQKDF